MRRRPAIEAERGVCLLRRFLGHVQDSVYANLESPRWDSDFSLQGGSRELLQKILDVAPSASDDLIKDFVYEAEGVDSPELALAIASPYFVDVFEKNLRGNWNGFKAYSVGVLRALHYFTGPERDQLTNDKRRIGFLLVEALELSHELEDGQGAADCFRWFVGCLAALNGDDVLGMKLFNQDI